MPRQERQQLYKADGSTNAAWRIYDHNKGQSHPLRDFPVNARYPSFLLQDKRVVVKAFELESQLEAKLLEDAIKSAQLALQELEEETRKIPYERRSGLRLREKALRTERAFNRLRALRKGELLPERHPDE